MHGWIRSWENTERSSRVTLACYSFLIFLPLRSAQRMKMLLESAENGTPCLPAPLASGTADGGTAAGSIPVPQAFVAESLAAGNVRTRECARAVHRRRASPCEQLSGYQPLVTNTSLMKSNSPARCIDCEQSLLNTA